jgi:hypothetical protein
MSIFESFQHLYSDTDDSPLNLAIGVVLDIARAQEGRHSFHGDFEAALNALELQVAETDIEEAHGNEIQALIDQVRDIGPPQGDPSSPDPEKPK